MDSFWRNGTRWRYVILCGVGLPAARCCFSAASGLLLHRANPLTVLNGPACRAVNGASTELAREAAGIYKVFFGIVRPFQKGPEAGADTVVYAATVPELATVTGKYIAKHAPIETSRLAHDQAAAERL